MSYDVSRGQGAVSRATLHDMKLLNEANGAGPEVAYNKGIILIQKGDNDENNQNKNNNETLANRTRAILDRV